MSTHPPRGGEYLPLPPDTWDTTEYGQQEGGTHPTGMLSCSQLVSLPRLFWSLAVLGATAILIYVIVTNIIRLRSHEKTVNVEVTYPDELDFPTVTICNQNQFRYEKFLLQF